MIPDTPLTMECRKRVDEKTGVPGIGLVPDYIAHSMLIRGLNPATDPYFGKEVVEIIDRYIETKRNQCSGNLYTFDLDLRVAQLDLDGGMIKIIYPDSYDDLSEGDRCLIDNIAKDFAEIHSLRSKIYEKTLRPSELDRLKYLLRVHPTFSEFPNQGSDVSLDVKFYEQATSPK
jgi:hypothetical protein